jgi:hypothetical protein
VHVVVIFGVAGGRTTLRGQSLKKNYNVLFIKTERERERERERENFIQFMCVEFEFFLHSLLFSCHLGLQNRFLYPRKQLKYFWYQNISSSNKFLLIPNFVR